MNNNDNMTVLHPELDPESPNFALTTMVDCSGATVLEWHFDEGFKHPEGKFGSANWQEHKIALQKRFVDYLMHKSGRPGYSLKDIEKYDYKFGPVEEVKNA